MTKITLVDLPGYISDSTISPVDIYDWCMNKFGPTMNDNYGRWTSGSWNLKREITSTIKNVNISDWVITFANSEGVTVFLLRWA